MNPLWIVIAIAGIGLAITVADLALKPTFRRLAVRSISRRRGEAALIVVGAMFGTAIIGAALIVGDSFDGSIRDIARTELGPVDIVASIRPGTDIKRATLELEDRVAHSGIEHVDGILPMVEAPAVLDNGRRGDRQEIDPSACLAEVDFSQARRFGDDDAITGMAEAGATPSDSEVVVSRAIADDLTLRQGDDLTVHLYGQSRVLRVRQVLPTVGVAGYCGALVAPGVLEELWSAGPGATAAAGNSSQGPAGDLLISLDGGVFDTTAYSPAAVRDVRAAVRAAGQPDADVTPVKARRLESAERNGSQLRTIFSGIGGFSVVSGVLLLVNLVIMLAEERKVEFGLLRAVGFKRASCCGASASRGRCTRSSRRSSGPCSASGSARSSSSARRASTPSGTRTSASTCSSTPRRSSCRRRSATRSRS